MDDYEREYREELEKAFPRSEKFYTDDPNDDDGDDEP
jgi:hypothetical protein